jgi:predicted ester cyclase
VPVEHNKIVTRRLFDEVFNHKKDKKVALIGELVA